jgi:hypothetical protein
MEILSFTFGVLAMIAVLIIAVVVKGIVKVYGQQRQINAVWDDVHQLFGVVARNSDTACDDLNRVRTAFEKELISIDERVAREINDTRSYIDSRIDKLQLNIKEKGSKELLKG